LQSESFGGIKDERSLAVQHTRSLLLTVIIKPNSKPAKNAVSEAISSSAMTDEHRMEADETDGFPAFVSFIRYKSVANETFF
jgi:hypothetical protein